jgi:hypothetical protein
VCRHGKWCVSLEDFSFATKIWLLIARLSGRWPASPQANVLPANAARLAGDDVDIAQRVHQPFLPSQSVREAGDDIAAQCKYAGRRPYDMKAVPSIQHLRVLRRYIVILPAADD